MVSMRSVLTTGVATVTAGAVVLAPSVQPPPRPVPAVQLTAAVQTLAEPPAPHLLQRLLTDPLSLLGPAAPVGTITPPPAPIDLAIAPNLADSIDNIYNAVEPWVQYGFQVATDIVAWVPWVGWLAGQIMVFYTFGEGIVASGVFNVTDWLRGQGGVIENVVDFGVDVGLAFIWLGIDEYNYFLPPLPPLPFPYPPRPPAEGRFLALESLMRTPQPPMADITDAIIAATETFFSGRAGVTEFGLFNVAEPVLRELNLDLIADQIDINSFDLPKPATIEEVEGISELLTVPERVLNEVAVGQGPLAGFGTEAGFVPDRLVTRVGNAGTVVESYVQKQVDRFNDLATPLSRNLQKTVGPSHAEGTQVSPDKERKGPLKRVVESFKATPGAKAGSLGESSGKPKPVKAAVEGLTSTAKSLREGVRDALRISPKKAKAEQPE